MVTRWAGWASHHHPRPADTFPSTQGSIPVQPGRRLRLVGGPPQFTHWPAEFETLVGEDNGS